MNTTLIRQEISRILNEVLDRRDVHMFVSDENVLYLAKRFEDVCPNCDKAIKDGSVGSLYAGDDFVHDCGEENVPHEVAHDIKFSDESYLRSLVSTTLAALDASLNPKETYHVTTSLVAIASTEVETRSKDLAIREMEKAINSHPTRYTRLSIATQDGPPLEVIIDFDIDDIQARAIEQDE